MTHALSFVPRFDAARANERIAETVAREEGRLRNFIRRRVPDEGDAEDILQDVFYELVQAYRLMKPIEQVGSWLYRVARNRIIDRFRKRRPEALAGERLNDPEDREGIEGLLPALDGGPEAMYARNLLLEELELALAELPEQQRAVFLAHEIEGRSFKEISEATGASVSALLSRKHYAVLHLRRRLQAIYEEFQER